MAIIGVDKSITETSKEYKPVYWTGGRQAPANRTIWTERVMFHIIGNDPAYDFDDVEKFERVVKSGREVTAYYYREGHALIRGSARTVPSDSEYFIATIKRGCNNYEKLYKKIMKALANNGKAGVTITF